VAVKVFNGPDLIILKNQQAGQHSSFFSFSFSFDSQSFNNHNINTNEQTISDDTASSRLAAINSTHCAILHLHSLSAAISDLSQFKH
jgi:hypothetical protein